MAIYHLQINAMTRRSGRSAPAAAAYRSGQSIRDERTGVLHNFSRREDVRHREILLPAGMETAAAWATDRATLWNAAERAEKRRDSRLAREYVVALPAELSAPLRTELARAFARDIAERYAVAVDLAVHDPRAAGDQRNYHAHLMSTTREITPVGLGPKSVAELGSADRMQRGLSSGRRELIAVRERWAELANEALHAAGLEARIDHRSLAAQGIDREPKPRIPYVAIQMERRGMHSEIADRIRAQYDARLKARRELQLGRDLQQPDGGPSAVHARLEQVRAQARDAWLKIRAEAAQRPASREKETEIGKSADLDLSL